MSIDLSKIILPTAKDIELELSRRNCQSFAEFVKEAWHILEPTTELKWGWAMDAECQHLEAVADGRILRLLMNVPPGFMKSLLVAVFFPAFLWGPRGQAEKRIVGTSHSRDLATRDSMKCRTLIESEWFQDRWPLKLKADQNAKTNFGNDAQGVRESAAFTKMTGKRGDIVILDDPISAFDANSEAELRNAEIAFLETLPSRINSEQSAIIVIMQRLSELDTSGLILDRPALGYEHLILPMRYEPELHCVTSIGFEDPRKEDGELLFPEFFNEKRVATLEASLGAFGIAGQLQQRPVPRSGGLFNREWFQYIQEIPVGTKFCRGWDLAASTEMTAAYTAGVKIGKAPDGRLIIADSIQQRLTGNGVRVMIKQTAIDDGIQCRVSVPQDPGQAGKAQVALFAEDLSGFDCRFSPESGDKVTRALPVSAQAEAGNIYIVSGDWNKALVDECALFPNGKYKDQVDALSRAYFELMRMLKFDTVNVSSTGPRVL